ncbi:MAG: hypothetical protein FJ098_01320 [Deltaproteobacteria bacterium]|nr:hypothetical protein [Deltaproteobacteria bacterium]
MQRVSTETRQRPMQEDDEFYCKNRRRKLLTGKCLEDYMNANALERKRSACWRCFQGRRTREDFSEG